MSDREDAGKWPPRMWLGKEPCENSDVCIALPDNLGAGREPYISLEEHQALLREARAEAAEWERLANEWRSDYDKLKEKYEPMIVVTSEEKDE